MMHTLFHLCLLLIRLLCANIDKNLNGPNVNESTQQNYRKLRVGIWFHCNPRLKRMIITNIIIFIEHWWANKVAYDVFLRYFYFFSFAIVVISHCGRFSFYVFGFTSTSDVVSLLWDPVYFGSHFRAASMC